MKLSRLDLKDQQMTVHAGTVLKVLGKSSLFILDILVRESIQNSLDAVSPKEKEFIRFDFDIVEFGSTDDIINSVSFLEQQGGDPLFTRLKRRIKENDPVLLILSDRGTTGLSGPVRRSDPEWKDFKGRKNFENLVYQLGHNHGTSGAGGSYGFGKSIYYRLSAAGLVMYYSRSQEGERLAFSMISTKEMNALATSTGISWWGENYSHKRIEFSAPIENSEKIGRILEKMNLAGKRFKQRETGTLICIVAPDLKMLLNNEDDYVLDFGGSGMATAEKIKQVRKMADDSVVRWYWPRLTTTDDNQSRGKIYPLKFFNGKKEIFLPQKYNAMAELLRAAEISNNSKIPISTGPIKTVQITHKYGKAFLGTIAYQIIDMESTEKQLNNIAMIRAPRMVVFEIPVQMKPETAVAAVFLVNSSEKVYAGSDSEVTQSLDDAFKDCESATHSEWNYHDFPPEKNWFKAYVKTVMDKVVKTINYALSPVSSVLLERKFSEAAKALGQILLAESSGGIQTFKTAGSGSNGGVGNSGKANLTVKVVNTEFKDSNSAVYAMELNCPNNGNHELYVMAKGAKDLYDSKSWNENLGNEFPFQITNATCDSIKYLEVIDQSSIRFKTNTDDSTPFQLSLTVKFVKRDALITFLVKSILVTDGDSLRLENDKS